jgi:2-oxoglutarate decarboxylase
MNRFDEFGANSGLVEELYRQYLGNPSAVNEEWRAFFAAVDADGTAPPEAAPGLPPVPAPVDVPKPARAPARRREAVVIEGDESEVLRGAAARVAENMEASLSVPTATSVRTIPARLLEVNRRIINDHLVRRGDQKVSFTHLIAFAVLRALEDHPALNTAFSTAGDALTIVRRQHVNLGIAVDVVRRDGSRTLLVPNIKRADTLDFAQFWRAYEDVIARVRNGSLGPDDFAGTTATITNPGMLGTVHSIPRLLPGQGFIVGVGAIGPPAEFEGTDTRTLADLGIGSVVTLTSTYDHRIIGGAESGEFLRGIHERLIGGHRFYDEVFQALDIPSEPARWAIDKRPHPDHDDAPTKVVRVNQLVNMFRVRGHLIADLDPLRRRAKHWQPELDLAHYGLTIWDLDRTFPIDVGGLGASQATLREILERLRETYAAKVGVEYMHIQDPDQKEWIRRRMEADRVQLAPEDHRWILDRLTAAETLERFLHTKYIGHKRFSLEGAEALMVMLDALCRDAADASMERVVLGMTHRGRLNVLVNLLGKPYREIFRQFEGDLDPAVPYGSGDVKYHLGATSTYTAPSGATVEITLAANPSHLEAVDPVVVGMARACADRLGPDGCTRVLPVLVHGDAAFAGQGVVAETLNLSDVPGYHVGGTVHIVVNNQLGFTTPPESGRSSVYPTDVAKMVQAPIFHVNGDDPEAAVRVTRLAFDFRNAFRKDVVVDLFCYRRYGHSEIDEPSFTQPRMYARIDEHPSVRALYTQELIRRGDLEPDAEPAVQADLRARLADAYEQTRSGDTEPTDDTEPTEAPDTEAGEPGPTGVALDTLRGIVERVTSWPEGFAVHPKLQRGLEERRSQFEAGEVDWSLAEACAFGSLLLEGIPVRLAGQDSRRGTFSQRHAVLISQVDETEYVPLGHLDPGQAPFMLYDSTLSEYAALGFEYGYSVEARDALVCWEAQYGDFANGAQIVIDQFVSAGDDKWGQASALTMLLPHGYEGQGPEHSSARIERYLQLSADGNLRIAFPSTAAQYFHLLRHHAHHRVRVPLVCFTPKRYLRMPQTRSRVTTLIAGQFEPLIEDAAPGTEGRDGRVLFCSGMLAHELAERRAALGRHDVIVRVERLAPFPTEAVARILEAHRGRPVWWIQEEPENMGAAAYVVPRLSRICGADVGLVARPASASTATGSSRQHEREQARLLDLAFADGG